MEPGRRRDGTGQQEREHRAGHLEVGPELDRHARLEVDDLEAHSVEIHLFEVRGVEVGVEVGPVKGASKSITRRARTGASTNTTAPTALARGTTRTMRRLAVSGCPGVEAIDGTAEQIPFADDAVDAVFVTQAFHWSTTSPR